MLLSDGAPCAFISRIRLPISSTTRNFASIPDEVHAPVLVAGAGAGADAGAGVAAAT